MSQPRKIRRVLIANRGEIAVRIIRTLRELGVESYVVASDADRDSLPVRLADGAVHLGGFAATESYGDIEKVVAAAKTVGADAVHPGYGFLAESADFARGVEDAGIRFIGPTPEQIASLGDKLAARIAMTKAGIGPVPGNDRAIHLLDEAKTAVAQVGFPLLLKAAAGGGGRGIRIVREASELDTAFRLASSEAEASFGSPLLFAERYLECARHVEIQLVGDGKGGGRFFQERDCSIQRRLQKLVEETPSPAVDDTIRERLLHAAREVVTATKYRSAGTLEFLLSPENELFFLEMNTRIQVEHPVSEATSGTDIVALQIAVAEGQKLDGADLADVVVPSRGVAIEFRINAEDPLDAFRPAAGTIESLWLPNIPGVRIDTALFPRMEVTPYYDPLLAKVIASGVDRPHALARLRQALEETLISGVMTTLPVGIALLDDDDFRAGDYHCQFLAARLEDPAFLRARTDEDSLGAVAAALAYVAEYRRSEKRGSGPVAAPPRPDWCLRLGSDSREALR